MEEEESEMEWFFLSPTIYHVPACLDCEPVRQGQVYFLVQYGAYYTDGN